MKFKYSAGAATQRKEFRTAGVLEANTIGGAIRAVRQLVQSGLQNSAWMICNLERDLDLHCRNVDGGSVNTFVHKRGD
jgi:hypothetical protein